MAIPMVLEKTEFDERTKFYNECLTIVVRFVREGRSFTQDDIREHLTTQPPHPNAWGGLHRQQWWRDLVEDSGRMARSRNKLSRGHRVIVWQPKKVA